MFVVPVDTPGVTIVRDVGSMDDPKVVYGQFGNHAEITYEDVRVPADHLIGPEGSGFVLAQARLGPGRIHHCMRWLGQSQRAFDMLCERALSRYTHGSLLAEKQTVQNWIADSRAEMHAARLMTLHAAWKMDRDGRRRGARRDRDDQVLRRPGPLQRDRPCAAGPRLLGYSTDLPLEAMYRWARAARIYDGPDEVHRQTVARQTLKALHRLGGPDRARPHARGRGEGEVRRGARAAHRGPRVASAHGTEQGRPGVEADRGLERRGAAQDRAASACWGPTSCRPTGAPTSVSPAQTVAAGFLVMLNG